MWSYLSNAIFFLIVGFGLGRLRWYGVYHRLLGKRTKIRASRPGYHMH
ncbi:hypothetical protein LSG25_07355 [Paralcaligenes sp. KSB-10]|jgi:hypothetical protein|nr:hypothetical protein [Paralcaligenes sp. KSB-10]UHL65684.1 hypothetical protein LSG25_07355 [Paralcaligenes sp. KSB-10]